MVYSSKDLGNKDELKKINILNKSQLNLSHSEKDRVKYKKISLKENKKISQNTLNKDSPKKQNQVVELGSEYKSEIIELKNQNKINKYKQHKSNGNKEEIFALNKMYEKRENKSAFSQNKINGRVRSEFSLFCIF